MAISRQLSRILFFLMAMFFLLAVIDLISHRVDTMTYAFTFLGFLSAAVGFSLHNVETRLAALENILKQLKTSSLHGEAESVKDRDA